MKKILRQGIQKYEIRRCHEISPNEKVIEFHNEFSAFNFLRSFKHEYINMIILRDIFAEENFSTNLTRINDHEILTQLAHYLVFGNIRITILPNLIRAGGRKRTAAGTSGEQKKHDEFDNETYDKSYVEKIEDNNKTKKITEIRKELARDFYKKQGFEDYKIDSHLEGIDFEKPVEIVKLKKGTILEQWQIPNGNQGNYYAYPGTPPTELGINDKALDNKTKTICKKVGVKYIITEDIEILTSTAKDIEDSWSVPGKKIYTKGGGKQFFSTEKSKIKPAEE